MWRNASSVNIQDKDSSLQASVVESSSTGKNWLVITNPDWSNVYPINHICTDNTTIIPLWANEVFTWAWQDCLQFQEVNVSISTDKNSATDWLEIQWSDNGTDIADKDNFTVYANNWTNYTPNPAFRYVRLKYTNGNQAQWTFHLMTILRRWITWWSFHRITDTLKDDSDARLNLSVLKLRTAQNNYVSGSATNNGNFKVSLEELESDVKWQQEQADSLAITFAKDHYDATSRLLSTIWAEHSAIHKWWHFTISDYATNVNSTYVKRICFTTPNTDKRLHFFFAVFSAQGMTYQFYEWTNITGWTPLTPVQNQRNIVNGSTATIVEDPTVNSVGTRLIWWLAGWGRQAAGDAREKEFVLKQNTTYMLVMSSLYNNNDLDWDFEWYEYTHFTNN
jgi:hypothetical protein